MKLEILPFPCEYISTLTNFVVNNQEHFQTNSAVHNVNTRNRDHLPTATANLLHFQKKCTLCWHQNLQQFTIKPEKSYE
jgi:hypothetical protein